MYLCSYVDNDLHFFKFNLFVTVLSDNDMNGMYILFKKKILLCLIVKAF